MLPVPAEAPAPERSEPELLTHSRSACASQCLRKHYLAFEIGLRRERDTSALYMGSVYHKAHEMTDLGSSEQQVCDYIRVAIEDPVEAETILRLWMGYRWRWGDDRLECVVPEQLFKLRIRNPETGGFTNSFLNAGKMDRIVRLADGRIALQEYKTTGDSIAPDSDYWLRLQLDQQVSRYMLAARELGYDVKEILYDVTHKPGMKPKQIPILDGEGFKIVLDRAGQRVYLASKKDGSRGKPRESASSADGWELQTTTETAEQYGERLTEDIGLRPDFYYARVPIARLEDDLADFELEMWQQQQQLRACQNAKRWYRNTNACVAPYRCEYLGTVCHLKIDPAAPAPAGFVFVENKFPELA